MIGYSERTTLLRALLAEPVQVVEEQVDIARETWDGPGVGTDDLLVKLSIRKHFMSTAFEPEEARIRRWWNFVRREVFGGSGG